MHFPILLSATALYLAGLLMTFVGLQMDRVRAKRPSPLASADWKEALLGSVVWPILLAATVITPFWVAVLRCLPKNRMQSFERTADGRLAEALSIHDLASATMPDEQDARLVVIVGGVGKIRIAAKSGLVHASYGQEGSAVEVDEMTYIGELETSYRQPVDRQRPERRAATERRTAA